MRSFLSRSGSYTSFVAAGASLSLIVAVSACSSDIAALPGEMMTMETNLPGAGGSAAIPAAGGQGSNVVANAGGTMVGNPAAGGSTGGPVPTAGTTGGPAPTGGTTGAGGAQGNDTGGMGGETGSAGAPAEECNLTGGEAPFGLGGPSRCCGGDLLFCEDFENGLDPATWTTVTSQNPAGTVIDVDAPVGTATVESVRAFRGTNALHIVVPDTNLYLKPKVAIVQKKSFPLDVQMLYGRMYLWFDSFTTLNHFNLVEMKSEIAGEDWLRFGGQNGTFGVGSDHGPSGDWGQNLDPQTQRVPTMRWVCIEFLWNGLQNDYQVWQDDVELPTLHVGANQHPGFNSPEMTSIWFGWQTYDNRAGTDYWVDEIALDTKPIGCAK